MKKTIGLVAIMMAFIAPLAAEAQEAAVSANVGYVSEYYYRGIAQNTSSASAGLDVGIGAVYLGTWSAEVDDGAEVDLYGGIGFETESGLSLSVGGTGYFYTGDFDSTYLEGNLGLGYGPVSAEFSYGTYDDDDDSAYWFLGLTAETESGLYGTFGTFGGDETFYAYEGMYGEAGYGFTAGEMDFSVSAIFADETLSGFEDGELSWVFGVSKTFDLN